MNSLQTRQVVVLWGTGMSMAEISQRMGISIWQIAPVLPRVPEIMLEAACHVAEVERKVGKHPKGVHPLTGKGCPWVMALDGGLTVGLVESYQ